MNISVFSSRNSSVHPFSSIMAHCDLKLTTNPNVHLLSVNINFICIIGSIIIVHYCAPSRIGTGLEDELMLSFIPVPALLEPKCFDLVWFKNILYNLRPHAFCWTPLKQPFNLFYSNSTQTQHYSTFSRCLVLRVVVTDAFYVPRTRFVLLPYVLEHCRRSMIECVEEDNEVCRPSQGHTAVELLNLVLEELLQLRSLRLQCWRQEPILNGEHLVMDVDVLHLEEEMGVLQSPHFYNKWKKGSRWQPSTHLLKRVEAVGFAQTHQILQDGLLQLLLTSVCML